MQTWMRAHAVPVVSEGVVHAVQQDVEALGVAGGKQGHSPGVEGVSAVQQGDGGQVNGAQLSHAAPCRL